MIPNAGHFVLFIRHGERAPLPPDEPFGDVDLTPSGYAEVARLAAKLRGRIHWTAASPFSAAAPQPRGSATSQRRIPAWDGTVRGWSMRTPRGGSSPREAPRVWSAPRSPASLRGIRGAEDAVPLLLSAGLERAHLGSGVCVSHDAVLMPAMAWLFGADAVDEWLAPLGGFAVEVRAGGPVAVWRDRERRC